MGIPVTTYVDGGDPICQINSSGLLSWVALEDVEVYSRKVISSNVLRTVIASIECGFVRVGVSINIAFTCSICPVGFRFSEDCWYWFTAGINVRKEALSEIMLSVILAFRHSCGVSETVSLIVVSSGFRYKIRYERLQWLRHDLPETCLRRNDSVAIRRRSLGWPFTTTGNRCYSEILLTCITTQQTHRVQTHPLHCCSCW